MSSTKISKEIPKPIGIATAFRAFGSVFSADGSATRISNEDKWVGALGLNLGLVQGFSISGEYNESATSDWFVLSSTYRF